MEPSPPQVILYTRENCTLCEEAAAVLQRHGLSPQIVDIETDSALAERYHGCVPVVALDGIVRFRGRINEVLLRRQLGRFGRP